MWFVFNNCFIFKQVATVRSMFFKLRVANQSLWLGAGKRIRTFESERKFNSFKVFIMCFVLVISELLKIVSSTNKNSFFF